MAKNRDRKSGGSNMGLIITLVIFVLATVILAVTTYIGFAEQADLRNKEKDALQKASQADAKANWYRFQSQMLRMYTGHKPPAGPNTDKFLTEDVKKYEDGNLGYDKGQDDAQEFGDLIKELQKRMPWPVATQPAPTATYQTLVTDREKDTAAVTRQLENAEDAKKTAEDEKKAAETTRDKDKKTFEAEVKQMKTKAENDLDDLRKKLDAEIKKSLNNAAQKEEAQKAEAVALAKLKDAEKKRDTLEAKLLFSEKTRRDLVTEKSSLLEQVSQYREKLGGNALLADEALQNAKSLEILKNWQNDWRIVDRDKTGKKLYINLGRADKLAPQVTFSVHAVGADGKLSITPKGTVEVIQVVGDKMAVAQVTSLRDEKKDPISKGDRLFNATWDPYRRKSVAIAGLADLGMDGTDSSEDLRRLLANQNVDIHAYIDTKGNEPKVVGKGVSVSTDYLILCNNLEEVNHVKARTRAYAEKFDRLKADLKEKAQSNAVLIIPLRRYLDMIGYRPPVGTTVK